MKLKRQLFVLLWSVGAGQESAKLQKMHACTDQSGLPSMKLVLLIQIVIIIVIIIIKVLKNTF